MAEMLAPVGSRWVVDTTPASSQVLLEARNLHSEDA